MIIRSKAPLRLGLAGGGTDVSPYCDIFGGAVLNTTIDMFAYCTIIPTNDGKISISARDIGAEFESSSMSELEIEGDCILHKGVYNRIVKSYMSSEALSFKMITYSDAPPGSGLGSSSTMIVCILKAFMEWLNLPLGEYDMAMLAYEIERVDLQLLGGKQDQYAATFGGFNYMEFSKDNRVIVNPLRIKNWIKNEFENSMLLYYTGTSRDSAKIIEDQVKSTSDESKDHLKGMHLLKESALDMKNALLRADFEGVAENLEKGWRAKKSTSAVISNPEIEKIYNLIMDNGGKAAKISGAGGGGYMMILCDPIKRYDLANTLRRETSGVVTVPKFTEKGAEAWTLY